MFCWGATNLVLTIDRSNYDHGLSRTGDARLMSGDELSRQTCLPNPGLLEREIDTQSLGGRWLSAAPDTLRLHHIPSGKMPVRSEERRVGKGCVSTVGSRGSRDHKKKKQKQIKKK